MLENHTEQRLANLYSYGIGGHLNEEDLGKGEDILDWAQREFSEEVENWSQIVFKYLSR